MALLNLLLIPILAALGLFDGNGDGGSGGDAGTGGASGGSPANGGASGGAGGAGQGGGTSGSTASGGSGSGGQAPPQQGTSLEDVEKLQRELNEARQQAAGYRNAGIQAIAAALGIELPKGKGDEGQEAAITMLQKEITDLRTEARESRLAVGLERAFTKLGANPKVTAPYIAAKVKDLDPKAADFTEKLEQIVQEAIDEEPALKAAQVARRSGGEFNGNGASSGETEDPLKLAASVPRG